MAASKVLNEYIKNVAFVVVCRAPRNVKCRKKLDKCKWDVRRIQEGKASKRFISINIYVTLAGFALTRWKKSFHRLRAHTKEKRKNTT